MPRPRRGAYIYRRPNRAGWYAFIDRDHKDISLGTNDEHEAQEKLARLLHDRRIQAIAPNDRRLTELFAECYERAKTNNTPKTAYEDHLNNGRVLEWLAARGIYSCKRLKAEIVEDYKTARRFDKVSAARINRELASWKKAMRIAVEWRVFTKDVYEWFVPLREPRPQPHQRGLTKKEIGKFLAAAEEPYRSLFRLVIGTGLRDDEARHLEMSDLDARKRIITVTPKPGWTTKGYRYRDIPATKQSIEAAKRYIAARPKMSLDPKGVWKRIQAACKLANIPKCSMHDFRRAWASHMLAAGHKLEHISRWLGHRDIITTMRYLRVVEIDMPKSSSLPF